MKIGAVSYLNTKPLIEYWRGPAGASLELDLPSRLADRLRDRHLDLGLIPVAEVLQQPNWVVVPDACIACRGPVWSVKLMSRVPPPQIGSLALDEGSRTSVVLCQVLLYHLAGVRPVTLPLPIDQAWQSVEADAVLVIGDRAMRAEAADFPYVWDLGEVWHDWTGLPFVFAVWTTHQSLMATRAAELRGVQQTLNAARDEGLRRLEELADRYAPAYGLGRDECRQYLGQYLHFRFGPAERRGLQRFQELARALQFVPAERELVYHECT